jgi:hypothetical protein
VTKDGCDSVKIHASGDEEAGCGMPEIVEAGSRLGALDGMGEGVWMHPKGKPAQSKSNMMDNRDRSWRARLGGFKVDQITLYVDGS